MCVLYDDKTVQSYKQNQNQSFYEFVEQNIDKGINDFFWQLHNHMLINNLSLEVIAGSGSFLGFVNKNTIELNIETNNQEDFIKE